LFRTSHKPPAPQLKFWTQAKPVPHWVIVMAGLTHKPVPLIGMLMNAAALQPIAQN
jgi:hypothetical protein